MIAAWSHLDRISNQFISYANSLGSGSPDHEFVVWTYRNESRAIMVMAVSTDGNLNSSNFAAFSKIPLDYDLRATQSLSSLAEGISDDGGSYDMSFALTLQATTETMCKCSDVFRALSQELRKAGIPLSLTFVFQPLPRQPLHAALSENILGLEENLPVDSILFDAGGTLEASDVEYRGVAYRKLAHAIEEIRAFSASRNNHSPYVYMNYANPHQDVFRSYGAQNAEFLKKTAARYDPSGFFQYRVSGGVKVSQTRLA